MHTDRKIGFAMGILLIGIVAALFFRNEPLLSTKVPGVRRERELNQKLRERDAAVYLNDKSIDEIPEQSLEKQRWTLRDVLEKMDERNKTAPVPVGAGSFAQRSLNELNDEDLDGYRPQKRRDPAKGTVTESSASVQPLRSEQQPAVTDDRVFGALPPLTPIETIESQKITLPPLPNPELSVVKDERGKDVPDFDFQPPESFDEYVVKYGDTLSGIAQRMLGSQKKYIEIYHANRDRMASPDRLDVGKPLRIPRVAESGRLQL
jgi:LysM repeat protein